jgi:transcription elongation factor GreA
MKMNEKEYLTKEKFEALEKELNYLKKEKRREVADQLEYTKSLGDLSENAEYHEARDAQAAIEDRIFKLEEMLKDAVIISGKHSTDVVSVGSLVTVVKEGEKEEKSYTLTGAEESDLSSGKISVRSPFGSAALGKKKGESFSYSSPSGLTITYRIIGIQ